MIADATIVMPDCRANGYHLGGLGGDDVVSSDAEQQLDIGLAFQPMGDEKTSSLAAPTSAEATAQHKPTTGAAENVKPEQKKAAEKLRSKAKTATSKAAAEMKPASRVKVKYVPQAPMDRDLAKLEELSDAALAGDTTALDDLRVALDRCPHIWRRLVDLEYLVELKMIALVAGEDPLREEAFRKSCSELRHHLLDGEPSSLATKMAASRVVMCWRFVQFLELRALESPYELRNIKQLEQAERRYQVAMRTYGMARQSDGQLQRLAQESN